VTRLFDSTVLIAHLRGQLEATSLLRAAVADNEAAASVLSRVEIEGGMRSGERADIARLFSALHMESVSDAIAARAGGLLRKYRRSHSGIDLIDYVIAATAEELDAELMTLNVRHFPMFKNLRAAF
jgi:predicted nucleic acid-binding protein